MGPKEQHAENVENTDPERSNPTFSRSFTAFHHLLARLSNSVFLFFLCILLFQTRGAEQQNGSDQKQNKYRTKIKLEQFSSLVQKLEDELKKTVLDKLPQRAVQMDALLAKCSAYSFPQKQNGGHDQPAVDLVKLMEEIQPVYLEAATDLHLIESKLRQMTSDVKLSAEVLTGEVLDRSLKLTEGLRRDVEDELTLLYNFQTHRSYHLRKMLKYPAQGDSPLTEFDQRHMAMLRINLAKVRNLNVALYGILSENLEHLTGRKGKKDFLDGPHSMLYY